jgi:lipoyl synthase
MVTKSNLILGMGETREEISEALRDLHQAGCDLITITQYLRPSERHLPVDRRVKPWSSWTSRTRRTRSASSGS